MSTKEDVNIIDDTNFWKGRIQDAKRVNHIHESVFQVLPWEFEGIWKVHKDIIKKNIPEESTVLDIGCGYGRVAEIFNPSKYTGCDFSPDFINEAKTRYPDFKFDIADMNSLPYPEKSFDWGLLVSVRHMIIHYRGNDAWFPMEKEIKRVCKNILYLEYVKPESNFEIIYEK